MKFMSDDGKIFDTEAICRAYEAELNDKAEAERIKKEKHEAEKKSRFEDIQKKNEELEAMINSYEEDYGLRVSFIGSIDPLTYYLSKCNFN